MACTAIKKNADENNVLWPDPEIPWILTIDGHIIAGQIHKVTDETVYYTQTGLHFPGEHGSEAIRRKNVIALIFNPPIDLEYTPGWLRKNLNWSITEPKQPTQNDLLLLVNNDRLSVHLLEINDKKVHFFIPGFPKPFSLPIRKIRGIRFASLETSNVTP